MLGDAEGSTVQDKCQKKNKNIKGRSAEPMFLSDLETDVATGKLQLLMLLTKLLMHCAWFPIGSAADLAHH